MATTITPPAAAEPSMSELRSMALGTAAPAKEPEPTTETSAPAPDEDAKTPETAPETVETKQVTEETEEPLPEGVKKRIAREAEKAARIQSEIDRAVSTRKSKEAELAKLTEADRGSDPVTKPQSAEVSKLPAFGETGHENETYEQFHRRELDWVKAEALREFREQQQTETAAARTKERLDAGIAKHGAEFPAMTDLVCTLCPVEMQTMIGSMKEWDTLAVHLAKNPGQLKELATEFGSNPYEVAAKLGRIRDALVSKQEPKTATTVEKPLPEPIAKVGGNASASGKDFQTALETGSMSQFKATVGKYLGKK